MTEFKDVNVGDKVRLTHKRVDSYRIEFVVDRKGQDLLEGVWSLRGDGANVSYDARGWSVEVLEPAPKPLPTEPGYYTGVANGMETLWSLSEVDGHWRQSTLGRWHLVAPAMLDLPLQRLVPFSDVEAARKATVSEIVKFLYRHDDRSWDVAANKVDLTFGRTS